MGMSDFDLENRLDAQRPVFRNASMGASASHIAALSRPGVEEFSCLSGPGFSPDGDLRDRGDFSRSFDTREDREGK